MKTQDLIKKLARDHKKTKNVSILLQVIGWISVSLFSTLSMIYILIPGAFGSIFSSLFFLLEFIAIFLLAISSGVFALIFSTPSLFNNEKLQKRITLGALISWFLLLGLRLTFDLGEIGLACLSPGFGSICIKGLLLFGILPGSALLMLVKKAAPTNQALVGQLIFVSLASFGTIGTHFECAAGSPAHLITWHFLPVLLFAFLGVVLGRKILRW